MLKILAAGLMISVLIVSVIMILQLAHAKGLKVYLTVNTNLASHGARIITYQFGSQVYSHDGFINNGITTFDLQYPDGLIENGNFRICVTALTSYLESCSDGYNGEAKRPERVTVSLFGSFTPQPQPQPSQGGQSQPQSQSITHLIIAIPNLTRWNPIKKLSLSQVVQAELD